MSAPTAADTARSRIAIVSCMRDEGQFLLEWVAYHRSIGFERVFLVTNDCRDGTDAMADRLAELDEVIHIRSQLKPDEAPQAVGMGLALDHPAMADVAWLLHCDADEFLNVSHGEGRVRDLIDAVGPCDAIAICWRLMGSDLKRWDKGLVLERLTRGARRPKRGIAMHKTMFRPDRFAAGIDHMPKQPLSPSVILRNTRGELVDTKPLFHPTRVRFHGIGDDQVTWDRADLHHYCIRAEDVFLLKNIRGDGMRIASEKYFVNSNFWRSSNRTQTEHPAIRRHLPKVRKRMESYLADPELARLDAAAFDWFDRLRQTHLTQQQVRDWTLPSVTAGT